MRMELTVIKSAEPQIHETAVVDPTAKLHKNVIIDLMPSSVPTVKSAKAPSSAPMRSFRKTYAWGKTIMCIQTPSSAKIRRIEIAGEYSTVVIGNDNSFREFVTIHRATGENCETRIGSHNMLQAYTHVAHNCNFGDYIVMSSFSGAAGHVIVEDHAVIGGMSGIHQFVKIGACAMVGGMSKIVQDVCPFVIVDGNPARVVGLNSVDSPETISPPK